MVFASFRIELSAKDAAMAGNIRISGLPYAQNSNVGARASLSPGYVSNITFPAGTMLVGKINPAQQVIDLYSAGSGIGLQAIAAAQIASNSVLWGSIVYVIA